MFDDLPLFTPPPVPKGMVRRTDPDTSHHAAGRVLPALKGLRYRVLQLVAAAGELGVTDQELRDLPEFAGYAHSTVGKRRTELTQAGLVEAAPFTRDGFQVWTLAAGVPLPDVAPTSTEPCDA